MQLDQLTEAMRSVINALLDRHLDFLARYPGRVVAQSANGRVDVMPDDTRVPGLQGIPLYNGLPGVTVELPADLGAEEVRVLIGFAGGDCRQPFAELWPSGTAKTIVLRTTSKVEIEAPEIKLGELAAAGVARIGDAVQAGPYVGVITAGSTKVKAE